MRLLSFSDLEARGHPHTRQHTMRLVRAGKFPAPVRIEGSRRVAWNEEEVNTHYERLEAQRKYQARPSSSGITWR